MVHLRFPLLRDIREDPGRQGTGRGGRKGNPWQDVGVPLRQHGKRKRRDGKLDKPPLEEHRLVPKIPPFGPEEPP